MIRILKSPRRFAQIPSVGIVSGKCFILLTSTIILKIGLIQMIKIFTNNICHNMTP